MNNTQNGSDLKVYQTLTYVITADGELYTTTASPSEINRIAEKSKFLQLGDDYINTSFIRKIFIKKIDDVDNAILQIGDKELRSRIQTEIDRRRKEGSRVNMEVLQNIFNRLNN